MEKVYVQYKRSKFSTRLLGDRLYAASHCWLKEFEPGIWRVGLTKFATRMLGEPVELDYEVEVGKEVSVGDIVGWIEGFKAVTDMFCPMEGRFAGGNSALDQEITLLQSDPYGAGWLYAIEGQAPGDAVDVDGYVELLNVTIDKMLGKNG